MDASPQRRLLVVDDSLTVRNLLSFQLSRLGNVIIDKAEHGVDALAKIEEASYDLLLIDINMPVMDGLKLIATVRAMDATRNVPIIVVTTRGQEQDRQRAMDLGADAYIAKPVNAVNLLDVANRLLAASSAPPR